MSMTREETIAAIVGSAEKLGHVPTRVELLKHAGLSRHDVNRYFGNYQLALKECNLEKRGAGMKVETERLFQDWTAGVRLQGKVPTGFEFEREGRESSRPFPLLCAPTNEFGVIFLFGALAERLGFQVLRIQGEYPDGEALRVVSGDRLQRVKIEFEYQSRNFLRHNHDQRKCDLIVCWE